MQKHQLRPGQVGKYWLDKKPGRKGPNDPWCRTWYDPQRRQTCHISLGTTDVHEASDILVKWVALNDRPLNGEPHRVQIERVLLSYWEDHARLIPSARTAKQYLSLWQQFWAGRAVSDITPNEQRRFREWLGEGRLAPSTIDKILSAGRAALLRAVKWQELTVAPHIFQIETLERKRSRRPLGRPITIAEMAAFIDAIHHRNLMVFVLLCANTLGRPAALFDLRRVQYDEEHKRLDLNPPGRVQTKKYRPVLPVSATLQLWLSAESDPQKHFITHRGKRVAALTGIWRKTLRDAGLPLDITPYSFRHGMSREFRKRHVPTEQISLFLGHRNAPSADSAPGGIQTTLIYAPYDPEFCENAVAAVDEVMSEVRALLVQNSIDDPSASFRGSVFVSHRKLDDRDTAALRARLEAGARDAEIAQEFGVTPAAVRKHRLKMNGKRAASVPGTTSPEKRTKKNQKLTTLAKPET